MVDEQKQQRRDSEGEAIKVKFDPRKARARKDNRRSVRHG